MIITATIERNSELPPLTAAWLDTPLGSMMAVSDEAAIYRLAFVEKRGLEQAIARLRRTTKSTIIFGESAPIRSLEAELTAYFDGRLSVFKTPIRLLGSPFQKRVWEALQHIPYGQTRSYLEQAECLDQPTAYRAVANANAANALTLLIPCHRVINHNGNTGGYGGGTQRKQWLIDHEKQASCQFTQGNNINR